MALSLITLQLTSSLIISSPQTLSFWVSSPKACKFSCNPSIVASLGYPSDAHFKQFSLEHITSFAKGTRTFADVLPHQILRFNLHAASTAYPAELASGDSGDDGGIGIGGGGGGGGGGGRNDGCRVGIRFHPIKHFHTRVLNSTHSDPCTGRAFALIWALQSVGSSNLRISCRRYSDVSVCASKAHTRGSINRVAFEKGIFENNVNAEEREEISGSLHEGQSGVEEVGLIPQQWRLLQVDLHKTKAEKKLELRLQELENVKRKALECQLKRRKIVEVSKSCDESDEGITLSDQEAVPGRLSQPFIEQDSVSSETTARSNVKKRNGTQQTSLTAQRKNLDSDLDLLFTNDELACLKRSAPDLTKIHCEKWPALHALVASGQFFLLDEFLKSEIDVNAYDEDGYTAVHRAVLGRKETAVSQLLRAGADVNIYDEDGASLLHFSVQTGSLNLVRLLVKYGVDVNHADEYGWTPLHVAALTGREDIVRHLLGSGADKHLKTKDGHTPLDICLALGKGFRTYAVAKSLKRLPKVDMPTAGLVVEAEDNAEGMQYS